MFLQVGILEKIRLTFKTIGFRIHQFRQTTKIYTTVYTKLGAVRGVTRNTNWGGNYLSFEKIPYGKPPVGKLRFRAPEPVEPWAHELDCTSSGDKPLQKHSLFNWSAGTEDCLYLNVYAKNIVPKKLRPVMVWIYGGRFESGEATREMYSPDFFMSKEVVLVTINYRLSAIGFLSLDDPEVNVPGNAGLKDQLLALRWVQQNIEAFGGDPNNVTLFGESAGGASTHLLSLSPQSEGLIHKTIVMSGSALCPWALAPRNNWALRLAEKMGYTGPPKDKAIYTFLCDAKGGDIVKAAALVLNKEEKHNRIFFPFGPVVEPYTTAHTLIDRPPVELMQQTWSNRVPMMIGGTSFEGLIFYPEVTHRPATLDEVGNFMSLLPPDLDKDLDPKLREKYAFRLKDEYFGNKRCNMDNMMKFLDLESHREFWHPIYRTALSRQQHASAPTYVYLFDYDSPRCNVVRNVYCGKRVRGVCHGDDVYYLFNSFLVDQSTVGSPEHKVFMNMIDIWTSFAANSDPNCESTKFFKVDPLGNNRDIEILNISSITSITRLPYLWQVQLWNSFYRKN
ncbi:esterase B1-like [Drosophila nasuta]|uniref:esterase B1-like n=1 Tax=Drosophila nasuta TaxID=42062 RepID=UPI00295E4017|nr:esterase B1-like [Drosophila nasuta]